MLGGFAYTDGIRWPIPQQEVPAVAKQLRRHATVEVLKPIKLARAPITVRGFDTSGKFVCRLEINGAGVDVFAGEKGGKLICRLNWEGFLDALTAR